ncbi:DUF4465 domain-containing protein [Marinilabilia salmonicolor]|uniref:Uncharacterized protein DUF4465 n=1 Tax=Marinilabilia salmonicolor TaxID=989 RepID=A0A368UN41_9BACT|nr:DUF4465 domain-containing protein [Marinilabilia salmonicolor]RCW30208.1 uncharacterized protein DUF4465 [Marinilabilia salmonicolor]
MYKLINSFIITAVILAFSLAFIACEEETKVIPSPEIYLANQGAEIEKSVGDSIILEPKITYDIDASYQWKKNNQLLENNTRVLKDIATQLGRLEYFFSVETPYGTDSVSIPVDVIVLASFTELFPENLKNDSSWIGAIGESEFAYKDLLFSSQLNADSTWHGFGISNIQSTKQTEEDIPEHSVYSSSSSENVFALAKHLNGPGQAIPVIKFNDDNHHRLKSIEINNTTLGVFMLKYGNENFPRMGFPVSTDPDWFKVTITGISASGEVTGSKDFYLADYRSDNPKRDYIVEQWTTVDLSEIGEVNQLQFFLSSNKTNDSGEMITPQEFCIDNLKILY